MTFKDRDSALAAFDLAGSQSKDIEQAYMHYAELGIRVHFQNFDILNYGFMTRAHAGRGVKLYL